MIKVEKEQFFKMLNWLSITHGLGWVLLVVFAKLSVSLSLVIGIIVLIWVLLFAKLWSNKFK